MCLCVQGILNVGEVCCVFAWDVLCIYVSAQGVSMFVGCCVVSCVSAKGVFVRLQ